MASVVPVREGGFPAADHEGSSSEFVENTNDKSLLSVQLTSTLKNGSRTNPQKSSAHGPKCVLQLVASRGLCFI